MKANAFCILNSAFCILLEATMQILAKRLCWCGSGLYYEQCHKAFDQKLDDFRKKGYLVPPRAIIKNQAQIEGIKKSAAINVAVLDYVAQQIGPGVTTAQIDRNTWTEEMLDMLLEWIKTDPRGEEYRDLDWSKEYDLARNGDPNDTQTAL